MNPKLSTFRRRPLAARLSIAAAGLLCAEGALAATVTNCNDTGSGSLRAAIAATASGGTVDFSGSLPACTITLAAGEIPINVASLTILGPASNSITIDAGENSRIFNHAAFGTLSLYHLNLSHGKYRKANAKGGCIASSGNVALHGVQIDTCFAYAYGTGTDKAQGGAVYAMGRLTAYNTTISSATAEGNGGATGGAIEAANVSIQYSTISGSQARFPGKAQGTGAVFAGAAVHAAGTGPISIVHSTLSNDIANGANNYSVNSTAAGGCVFGQGTIYIGASTLDGCKAAAYSKSQGGAVYANGPLTISHSTISAAYAQGTNGAYGGAVRARNLTMTYSTLTANKVDAGPYGFAGNFQGGGLFLYHGGAAIANSTIDNNFSIGAGGGLFTISSSITVNASTISGNQALSNGSVSNGAGGIHMAGSAATLHISNSTIAFNYGSGRTTAPSVGGGVSALGTTVTIESSILSNNTFKTGLATSASDINCNCSTVAGANDLIMAVDTTNGVTMPAGMVIVTTDPHLVPLGNHGGLTRTHALIPGSPALSLGNNLANFTNDQRGTGFPRLNAGLADIGAYERQPNDDEIFYDGFR
jgi:hypothetical protein